MYRLSGTDIGAIMGCNPYATAYDVWKKRKFKEERPSQNKYTEWGLRLEKTIAEKYCEDNNVELLQGVEVFKGQYSGTPDFIVDDHGLHWGLEIKTAQTNWTELPKYYELQCRWYMMLLGYERWDLAVLSRGVDYEVFSLKRDLDIENCMLTVADEFLELYLNGDEEPFNPSVKQTTTDTIEDSSIDALIEDLSKLKTQEKLIFEEKNKLEDKIKEKIGTNKIVKGLLHSASWNTQVRSSLDKEKLENEILKYNLKLSDFKKESEFRVLRIK